MKHRVRKEMRAALAAMSAEVAAGKSHLACQRLIALPEFREADVVMIYLDIPNEVDIAPVARAAWEGNKRVLVPKVTWEDKQMTALPLHSLDEGLIRTPQGLREPASGEPCPVENIDFIVVPALAYDRTGNRLGRGAGFYDRFLSTPGMRATTCGLAFSEQVVDEVPVHANDCPVDLLVTDAEVLSFNGHIRPAGASVDGWEN
jgi:5-formyltetrahydrofolate cyclo-ligase